MSFFLTQRAIRRLAEVLPCVGCLLLLSGCENEYPQDLKYPARTDPLVTGQLSATPTHLDKPGQLSLILVTLEDDRDRSNVADPANLAPNQRQELESVLDRVFGTPLHPQVNADGVSGIEEDARQAVATARQALHLDDATLAKGSELYRIQCLHCHGLTGNGHGPTAPWVNPHPRDYRQGIFKFTSSSQPTGSRKPRRADLLRTLREGVEGTTMPSFNLLGEDSLEALASYVTHLSMRGQLEYDVMKDLFSGEAKDTDVMERVNGHLEAIARYWKEAESSLIRPDPNVPLPSGDKRVESVRNGFRLFRDQSAAGCIGCHKDYGREATFFYDTWGTIGRPTDLTTGVYRGGRRPIDFFWRINSGVNGSNMPLFSNVLSTKDIWDLVNFVQILPYPKMRQQYGVEID
jgi:mono/diheme cytochrome c family protein